VPTPTVTASPCREQLRGTDPNKADTDNDSLSDGYEPFESGTNPLGSDADGDSVPDDDELGIGSNPNDPDDPG
jgi:hypothetical protein